MPRPTQEQVREILTRYRADAVHPAWANAVTSDMVALIDAAWAERERLDRYINHKGDCDWWLPHQEGGGGCSCGLYALLDGPRVVSPREGGNGPPKDELEQYNREQRIRRAAYETGGVYHVTCGDKTLAERREEIRQRAARLFPLRKRVPKVIPDPHDRGWWRLAEEDAANLGRVQLATTDISDWRDPNVLLLTVERIRALAALLDDPFTVEETSDVEEEIDA